MTIENKNVQGREGLEAQLIAKLSAGQLGRATDSKKLIHKSRDIDGGTGDNIISKYPEESEILSLIAQAVGSSSYWLNPVNDVPSLPSNDPIGAVRFVTSEDLLYLNTSNGWIELIGSGGGTGGSTFDYLGLIPSSDANLCIESGWYSTNTGTDVDNVPPEISDVLINQSCFLRVYKYQSSPVATEYRQSVKAGGIEFERIGTQAGGNPLFWNEWESIIDEGDQSPYISTSSRFSAPSVGSGAGSNIDGTWVYQTMLMSVNSDQKNAPVMSGDWGVTGIDQSTIDIPMDGIYEINGHFPDITYSIVTGGAININQSMIMDVDNAVDPIESIELSTNVTYLDQPDGVLIGNRLDKNAFSKIVKLYKGDVLSFKLGLQNPDSSITGGIYQTANENSSINVFKVDSKGSKGDKGEQGEKGEKGDAGGSGTTTFYLDSVQSGELPQYETLALEIPTGPTATKTQNINSGAGEVEIGAWTSPELSVVNTSEFPAGVYEFTSFMSCSKSSSTNTLKIQWFKRSAGGVETLLAEASSNDIDSPVQSIYQIDLALGSPVSFLPDDRSVFKYLISTAGNSRDFTIYYASLTAPAFCQTPINIIVDQYLDKLTTTPQSVNSDVTFEELISLKKGLDILGVMAGGFAQKVPDNSWIGPQTDQGGWYLTNGITPSTLNSGIHLLDTGLLMTSGDGSQSFGQAGFFDDYAQFNHIRGGMIRDFFRLGLNDIQLQMDGGGGFIMNSTTSNWFDQLGNTMQTDANGYLFAGVGGKYRFQSVPSDNSPAFAVGFNSSNELVLFPVPSGGGGSETQSIHFSRTFSNPPSGNQQLHPNGDWDPNHPAYALVSLASGSTGSGAMSFSELNTSSASTLTMNVFKIVAGTQLSSRPDDNSVPAGSVSAGSFTIAIPSTGGVTKYNVSIPIVPSGGGAGASLGDQFGVAFSSYTNIGCNRFDLYLEIES